MKGFTLAILLGLTALLPARAAITVGTVYRLGASGTVSGIQNGEWFTEFNFTLPQMTISEPLGGLSSSFDIFNATFDYPGPRLIVEPVTPLGVPAIFVRVYTGILGLTHEVFFRLTMAPVGGGDAGNYGFIGIRLQDTSESIVSDEGFLLPSRLSDYEGLIIDPLLTVSGGAGGASSTSLTSFQITAIPEP